MLEEQQQVKETFSLTTFFVMSIILKGNFFFYYNTINIYCTKIQLLYYFILIKIIYL